MLYDDCSVEWIHKSTGPFVRGYVLGWVSLPGWIFDSPDYTQERVVPGGTADQTYSTERGTPDQIPDIQASRAAEDQQQFHGS